MTQFRHIDTKRADGVYITFTKIQRHDSTGSPNDYLFQDPEYREQDQARLDAWMRNEWHFIGIQAQANILIVKNGVGTTHTLTSAGLWGIESDSDESYFQEVFEEEIADLKGDIAALGAGPIHYETA